MVTSLPDPSPGHGSPGSPGRSPGPGGGTVSAPGWALLTVALVGVAFLTAACGGPAADTATGPLRHGGGPAFLGTRPMTPYPMPDLTLTATNGARFNLVTDTGYPVTLMFFGYTHCPDVCGVVMGDLASAYSRLPPSVRSRVQVVFVTTDPARDTPGVLRGFLDRFGPGFVGLTGPRRRIVMAARSLGVAVEGRHRLPGGGYDLGHSAQVIGFRGDRAPVIWTQGTPVPAMVHDISVLAGR